MVVLDLFCGEGGASAGYARAGFQVIGVDSDPRPLKRYPYESVQGDALFALDSLVSLGWYVDRADPGEAIHRSWVLEDFDLIHASPPCQEYSVTHNINPHLSYPDLIGPVRELLMQTGKPWVIENVVGAPLREPAMLCGSQFGRFSEWDGHKYVLKRHRLFETHGFTIADAGSHDCVGYRSVPVYGHGASKNRPDMRGVGFEAMRRDVMDIQWMTRKGLNEAIPPCYTEYVGNCFLGV